METLQFDIVPLISELATLVVLAVLTLVGMAIRRYFGLKAEEIWRAALHSALRSGVEQLSSGPETDRELAAESVVGYVKRSVPEAVKGLNGSDDVLRSLAHAKLTQAIGGRVGDA